ncbi:MAG: thiamine phosphate synthase, partial [Candidatus Binatia bacterium]
MALTLPPLYAILDPEQVKGRATEEALRELLRSGVTMLQLRVKSLAAKDFLALVARIRKETEAHRCRLIVNDR